jgi:flagella basal body P-ring formation protein FlgA
MKLKIRICAYSSLLMASILNSGMAAEQQDWQSHDSIRHAAEEHVRRSTAIEGSTRATVVANPLDQRLRLPSCASSLMTETPYKGNQTSRLTVEVGCPSPQSWKIYVPVQLQVFAPVVVAARPLARETVLTEADLYIEERELGKLSRGYVRDPKFVIGQKLRRPLQQGATVTPNLLQIPPAIKRGQIVTVTAASSTISVAMTGTALEAGAIGEIIDILNNSSKRRVQAIVRSARVVEVLLK